jgi:hypothetical protein
MYQEVYIGYNHVWNILPMRSAFKLRDVRNYLNMEQVGLKEAWPERPREEIRFMSENSLYDQA